MEVIIHLLAWSIVMGAPFLMMSRSGFSITLPAYLRHGIAMPLGTLFVFYVNYGLLIPRYLFNGKFRSFLLLNILLVGVVTAGVHLWQSYSMTLLMQEATSQRHSHPGPPLSMIILRDISTMLLIVALSTAIRMSGRWMQIENERNEAVRKPS